MVRHPDRPSFSRLGLTALLILAGVLLAKWVHPLLYGAELAFFSLPAWFALRRLSLVSAMAIAVVSSAAGVFLWGVSPLYALVPLEVLAVGFLVGRWKIRSMIIADFIYWFAAGIWIAGFGYHWLTDGESPHRALFLLIFVINGLLNVIMGELSADYLPLRLPGGKKAVRRVRLGDVVFHFTVVLLALPVVIFLSLSGTFQRYDEKLARQAETLADSINEYVNRLDEAGLRLAQEGRSGHLHVFDNLFHILSPQGQVAFILLDGNDRVIAANRTPPVEGERYDWREGGSVREIGPNFYLWLPDAIPAYNGIGKWAKGDYVSLKTLDRLPCRLIIRQPASDVQETMFSLYFSSLLGTSFLVLAAVPAAVGLARRLTGEIAEISRFFAKLPDHLESDAEPDRKESRIAELDALTRSFMATAAALRQMHREREAREEELRRLVHVDPLTGLDNRYSFRQYLTRRLAEAKQKGEKIACLFLDLDHLKRINDTLGHEAGDMVIAAVGKQLKKLEASGSDIRCFRLAGDEFIVVAGEPLPGEPESWAAGVCRELSGHNVSVNGQSIPLKASAGLAVFPEDGTDADSLLRRSDQAMYQSKRAARAEK